MEKRSALDSNLATSSATADVGIRSHFCIAIMSSDLAQTMKATTEAFLFAFNGSWSAETNKTTISLRAPECEHTMVPSSLDMPSKSNDQFSAYFRSLEGVVTNAKVLLIPTYLTCNAVKLTEGTDGNPRLCSKRRGAESSCAFLADCHYALWTVQE